MQPTVIKVQNAYELANLVKYAVVTVTYIQHPSGKYGERENSAIYAGMQGDKATFLYPQVTGGTEHCLQITVNPADIAYQGGNIRVFQERCSTKQARNISKNLQELLGQVTRSKGI